MLAKAPVLKPILDACPSGGTPQDALTDNVTSVASNAVREDAGLFRFAYRFSERKKVWAEKAHRTRLAGILIRV